MMAAENPAPMEPGTREGERRDSRSSVSETLSAEREDTRDRHDGC
jgi:hypothetical protein